MSVSFAFKVILFVVQPSTKADNLIGFLFRFIPRSPSEMGSTVKMGQLLK